MKNGIKKPQLQYTLVPPDGGWGWLIVIGSYFITALIPMIPHNFSILYSNLFHDNHTSSTMISWIFSTHQTIWNITSLLVAPMCAEFGHRRVAFTGAVIAGSSVILSSFVDQPEYLFFIISFINGIGSSLVLSVYQFLLPLYFERRRGMVLGFVTSGLCSGQLSGPFLVRKLQLEYGYQPTIAIMGAILLNTCVSASLYQPVEWHSKKVLKNEQAGIEMETILGLQENSSLEINNDTDYKSPFVEDFAISNLFSSHLSLSYLSNRSLETKLEGVNTSNPVTSNRTKCSTLVKILTKCKVIVKLAIKDFFMFRHIRVLFLTIATAFTVTIYLNFVMFVPFVTIYKEFDVEVAVLALAIMGALNIIVRWIFSGLTDVSSISARYYYIIGSSIMSAAMFGLSLSTTKEWVIATIACFGVGIGICMCLIVIICIEVMGLKLMPPTVGCSGIATACVFITVGPLIGMLRDATGDYNFCLKTLSILNLIPIFLMLFVPVAIKCDRKRFQQTEIITNNK